MRPTSRDRKATPHKSHHHAHARLCSSPPQDVTEEDEEALRAFMSSSGAGGRTLADVIMEKLRSARAAGADELEPPAPSGARAASRSTPSQLSSRHPRASDSLPPREAPNAQPRKPALSRGRGERSLADRRPIACSQASTRRSWRCTARLGSSWRGTRAGACRRRSK